MCLLCVKLGCFFVTDGAMRVLVHQSPPVRLCFFLCPALCQIVRSFTCPTFFFFHAGNAFESEDGSTLYVDIAAYDDPDILLDLALDRVKNVEVDADGRLQRQVARSSYKRLSIPLTGPAGGRLEVRVVCDLAEGAGGECCVLLCGRLWCLILHLLGPPGDGSAGLPVASWRGWEIVGSCHRAHDVPSLRCMCILWCLVPC